MLDDTSCFFSEIKFVANMKAILRNQMCGSFVDNIFRRFLEVRGSNPEVRCFCTHETFIYIPNLNCRLHLPFESNSSDVSQFVFCSNF